MFDHYYLAISIFGRYSLLGWIVAGILVIGKIVSWLSDKISALQVLKANILTPLAKKIKFKRLEKAAIKNDVEGRVNLVIDDIRSELPIGWADPMSIKWVQEESKESFVSDNKVVLRIKPLDKEDSNFAKALYLYLKAGFFPKTRTVLESSHYEAIMLQFCRRVIVESKPSAKEFFENDILEPVISKKNKVLEYLDRLEGIDTRGLFTGIFIREIHNVAIKIRFSGRRKHIGDEFSRVLDHLEEFLKNLNSEERLLADNQWVRQGPVDSYGLLLVAHPEKAAKGDIKGYVNRAKERSRQKIDHLYVFGTAGEAGFVKTVIEAISESADYELAEEFSLHRDYRGEKGGHGAMFTLRKES